MQRQMQITKDGSSTICIADLGVTYHSRFGAIQESMHVFIRPGLAYAHQQKARNQLYVFEMGFGTGLNALLSLVYATENNLKIIYEAIELYPLNKTEIALLNYTEQPFLHQYQSLFEKMHNCNWDEEVEINSFFTLFKKRDSMEDYLPQKQFDLIYYDPFSPTDQPHLWTKSIFDKLFSMLHSGGILTTYCSKGEVRRSMTASGFAVEKLGGPEGKREITRALKNNH